MAKRNTRTQINERKVQANAKRKGTRQKIELRVGFDVEALKADGYKLIGFDEED